MRLNKFVIPSVMLLIITISIVLRSPYLFSTSITNADWNYTTVLRHLEIWDKEGALGYSFNPIMSYSNQADKFINNNASNEKERLAYNDKSGNYYYTSYPQFAYIAPYILIKILNIEPSIVFLKIFNILIQVLTAFCIYLLLLKISKNKVTALVGYIAYIFLPSPFLNHMTNYMSDMFMQLFFVIGIYLFYRIITEKFKTHLFVLFAISLFFFIYTDWFGLFFAGTIFLYSIIKRREIYSRSLFYISFIIPIISVSLVVWQYSIVNNLENFLIVMADRYLNSYKDITVSTTSHIISILKSYIGWYEVGFITIGIFAVSCLVYIYSTSEYKNIFPKISQNTKWLILIIIFPIVLHNVVFLDWTSFHMIFFASLKFAILVSIILALVFDKFSYHIQAKNMSGIRMVSTILIVFFVFYSIQTNIHSLDNNLNMKSTTLCELGKYISKNSSVDKTIFIKKTGEVTLLYPINPVMIICAGRNIELFRDESSAKELMIKNNTQRGVLFTIKEWSEPIQPMIITNIEDISI